MTDGAGGQNVWPALPYGDWAETCTALHLWSQIIGKYRLARTPWVNRSWHATLYVDARDFTTSLVPDDVGGVEIALDLLDHAVIGMATDGRTACFDLAPMSVAEFHARFIALLPSSAQRPSSTAARTRCRRRSHSRKTAPNGPTTRRRWHASSGRASPSIAC